MSRNGLWHSRLKLTICSCSLLICAILIKQRQQEIEKSFTENHQKNKSDFFEDVDYALETLDYMQKLKDFKAYVRPVIEKESPLIEHYWSCYLDGPGQFHTDPWLEHHGFSIFSAYYDRRPNSLFPRNHAIQVLTMHFRTFKNESDVFCNIFVGKLSAVVKGYAREIWQRGWDPRDHFYIPYLITCPIPDRLKDLKEKYSISLSNEPCTNVPTSLLVQNIQKNNEDDDENYVAVCVKGMDFKEDISSDLIEWFEAQFLFGVSKIQLYTYTVSPKTQMVLDYYKKKYNVIVTPLTLPANSPNIPYVRSSYIWRNRQQKRRHELIPYNDCLYRHINTHRYILIIDTDEIIVPLQHKNYKDMLKELEKRNESMLLSSLSVRNIFKFPTNQTNTKYQSNILKNNRRSSKPSAPGEYGKSFTRTSNIATVFNHFALHRLSDKIVRTSHIPIDMAIKLHYKKICPIESQHECRTLQEDTEIDNSLDLYSDILDQRVQNAMKNIGI